ncbi:MAG: hypothetical protein WDZ35_08215 [Crocinitomicaceae bacterium]
MKVFTLIATIGLFFLLTACPEGQKKGPPKSPGELVIQWNDGGGMLPVSEAIYISNDSCSWKYWRYQAETVISWKAKKKELDDLYAVMVKNKFDQVTSTNEGQVYDRGGVSIHIEVDDQKYKIDNSGSSFIADQWQGNFSAISHAIQTYAKEKVNLQLLELPLNVAEEIDHLPFDITLRINNQVIYDPKNNLPFESKKVSVYPGDNRFEISLFYADSSNKYGGKVLHEQLNSVEKIDHLSKGLHLKIYKENNLPEIIVLH